MRRPLWMVLALLGLSAAAFALTPGTGLVADAKVAGLLLAVAVAAVLAPGWVQRLVGAVLLTLFALVVIYRYWHGIGPLGDGAGPAGIAGSAQVPVAAIGLAMAAGLLLVVPGPDRTQLVRSVAAVRPGWPRRLLGGLLAGAGAVAAIWGQFGSEPRSISYEQRHLPLFEALAHADNWLVPAAAGLLVAAGAVLAAGQPAQSRPATATGVDRA